jgi:hypothetical protein
MSVLSELCACLSQSSSWEGERVVLHTLSSVKCATLYSVSAVLLAF